MGNLRTAYLSARPYPIYFTVVVHKIGIKNRFVNRRIKVRTFSVSLYRLVQLVVLNDPGNFPGISPLGKIPRPSLEDAVPSCVPTTKPLSSTAGDIESGTPANTVVPVVKTNNIIDGGIIRHL